MNGYRSLHTCVMGPEGRRIEIQIRTAEMHQVAEYGVAAHWHYKQDEASTEGPQYRWLRHLLDILEQASGPEEFLEHTKLEMYQDQVFCFTPAGELIALPRGATPVDFAYAVHSEVGDRCVGARINGRVMPLRTVLGTATRSRSSPPRQARPRRPGRISWSPARRGARIRRFVRSERREEFLRLGKAILQKGYRDVGYKPSSAVVKRVLGKFDVKTEDDLYVAIGEGLITGADVIKAIAPRTRRGRRVAKGKDEAKTADNVVPFERNRSAPGAGDTVPVPIRGTDPGDGGPLRQLLPPAARRPDRRHRHRGQGGVDPHQGTARAWRAFRRRRNDGWTSPGTSTR